MNVIVNVLAFQAAWLACVFGAANGMAWVGLAAVAAVVGLHLARTDRPLTELALAVVCGAAGIAGEGALMAAGLAGYASPGPIGWLPPLWLVGMWVAFATTLNVAFAPLRGKPLMAAAVGATFGPVAYFAGSRIGAMTLVEPVWVALAAIGAMWAIALPALLQLSASLQASR